MRTVSKLVKEKNALFEDVRIPSIVVKGSELSEVRSEPSFFGNAFNICLDYAFYVKGVSEKYEPKNVSRYRYNEMLNGLMINIDQKKPLTIREIAILTKAEQVYRSGYQHSAILPSDLAHLKADYPLIEERISWILGLPLKWDKLVVEPKFTVEEVGLIGDGDFIVDDILFEVKCVKEEKITARTQKQLMMYYLLNQEKKRRELEYYKIKRFGYINPLRKQVYIWDVLIPEEVLSAWEEGRI